MSEFEIKDSGERASFAGGMVRDTAVGKISFLNVRIGPMLRRWAEHCTKGREKYPDPSPGVPNWTLAQGVEEYLRAKESAERHHDAWIRGERDEDHAAGIFFNVNFAEALVEAFGIDPALGVPKLGPAPAPAEPKPLKVGDRVRILAGPFKGENGKIEAPTNDGPWDWLVRPDECRTTYAHRIHELTRE